MKVNLKFLILFYLINPPLFSEKKPFKKENFREMIEFTRFLAKKKIALAEKYTPPGESNEITWDSSGTVQYFYKKFFNISIPRDSYSQFFILKKSGKFIEPNLNEEGLVDKESLKTNLKRGDILFWTNTHNEIPENREPPVSHVMIFIGVSKTGEFLMVGAGTKGNGETTFNGGIDLYTFEPNQAMGCVKSETGECSIYSKFIGHGRFSPKKN